ncbi:MAG: rod shape-determining protein MreB [Patescibacteria group bacterium]|jgi:rod shape-determining protein MreB|nr:rod shape-determining protein MreB [Patescibacteria group bacterium]
MWDKLKQKLQSFVSDDIGIDLGTANTLVYVRGRGIIINEPTVVAVNNKTGQVVAVGAEAKRMLGRTPEHIAAIRPLEGGVISDFEVTEEFLAHLVRRAQGDSKKLLGPRVVIGVPFGTTNVERRAVRDAARNAGARETYIVEQPMAAALGIRLPIDDASGSMIVDIGGGTTDITVISLSGVVNGKNIKIAGDRFNADIISYVRDEFKILIGERTAEDLKITAGAILAEAKPIEVTIRGRDLITGLPREVVVTDADVREAIATSIDTLVESIKEVLETTPPEVVSDVMRRGIYLVGGGALIRGLDAFLSEWLKVPVYVAEDPLTAVARGTGLVVEETERYRDIIVDEEHALPPTA